MGFLDRLLGRKKEAAEGMQTAPEPATMPEPPSASEPEPHAHGEGGESHEHGEGGSTGESPS